MSKNNNIGIIGFASIAKKAIIPAIKESQYFNLYAVATQKRNILEIIGNEYKCKVYTNYQDLIDDSFLNFVYIPLPNSLHYEWVKKSLLAKKHVLVEKSLACNLKEVTELNDIAKQNGCALIENFQFKKHSQLTEIIKLIDAKKIGDIRSIRSSFCFPPFADNDNIRLKRNLGGGALLDAGAYPLKLAQQVLGNKIEVSSAKLNYENKEVDIWGGGMISQKDGPLFLQFSFGFDHFYQCNVEIIGTTGKISTQRIFTAPPNYSVEILVETSNDKQIIVLPEENHFVSMLNYFYLCTENESLRNKEYKENILQALLIEQFLQKAHE